MCRFEALVRIGFCRTQPWPFCSISSLCTRRALKQQRKWLSLLWVQSCESLRWYASKLKIISRRPQIKNARDTWTIICLCALREHTHTHTIIYIRESQGQIWLMSRVLISIGGNLKTGLYTLVCVRACGKCPTWKIFELCALIDYSWSMDLAPKYKLGYWWRHVCGFEIWNILMNDCRGHNWIMIFNLVCIRGCVAGAVRIKL